MSDRGTLLVGASGLAREVLAAGIADVDGVLDDDPARIGTEVGGVGVVGAVGEAGERDGSLLVCIGPSDGRRRVVQRLSELGVDRSRFTAFRSRHACVGRTSVVGVGSILLDGVVVTADAVLGEHVVVMPNTTITHDDMIADFVTLAAGVALGGGVQIGEAAYLGMNSSVRQGVRIGAGATIGMGAVVIRDVPDGETWAGVPAQKVGGRP